MTVSFEFAPEFLDQEGIPLSVHDLKYGVERGWLRAPALIAWAVREVGRGHDDPVLLEVASLLRDQVDELPDVLAQVDAPDHPPRDSARKWLYLLLKAAYDRRQDLEDPLGVVEQIYADFDYPPAVASFVRYMPLGPGVQPGEAGLFDRWADFLETEHAVLRGDQTSP